jgi:hypothetical protein
MVWNDLGGAGGSTFEIGQARLVYTYGTYHTDGFPLSVAAGGGISVPPADRRARRSLGSLTGETALPTLEHFAGWPIEPDPPSEPPPDLARPADLVRRPPREGPAPLPSELPVTVPPDETSATPAPVSDPGEPEEEAASPPPS